jgi:hypothetical protein
MRRRLCPGLLLLILIHPPLHIPELLTHLPGCTHDGQQKMEHEPIQKVEHDRQKQYLG